MAEYGVTDHVNSGKAMKLHRTDCSQFRRTRRHHEITNEEAAAWLRDFPLYRCLSCIRTKPGDIDGGTDDG